MQKDLRQARRMCMMLFLASALFRVMLWGLAGHAWEYATLLPVRGGEMALGGWLALSWRSGMVQRARRWLPWVTVGGFAMFAASSWMAGSALEESRLQLMLGLPAVTIGFAGLLAMSLEDGTTKRLMSAGWLRWLGSISYGTYIFQLLFWPMFVGLTVKLTGTSGGVKYQLVLAVVVTTLSLGLASLSFHVFEKPFLRLKRFVPVGERKPRPDSDAVAVG